MSDYGQIDYLWSDYSVVSKQGRTWDTKGLLEMMAQKQPNIVVSNRFWSGIENPYGDCVTPEKYVPATGFGDKAWEVCHTMNESFGYSAHDKHWKSPEELFKILMDINSKGGNLLLNVGPDAKGEIPPVAVKILDKFGDYVQKYKPQIHESSASEFVDLPFEGKANTLVQNGQKTYNFFIYERPENGIVKFEDFPHQVKEVLQTASKEEISFQQKNKSLSFQLPTAKTDEFGWVVSVEL